ncbi:endogenous retrovirus group k member 18 pol [Limosa lapponica baueri]|uniref:RNA-directed DNA polymerase n=1 Tax=Limosa lapponica baueri TaxID=1758121 RepID=A0A2I0UD24_LIMLA|nr:endogenous retrovirus group k member 18 pol [Limosa lapponica baueri]
MRSGQYNAANDRCILAVYLLQVALANFRVQLSVHLPPHKLFTLVYNVCLEAQRLCRQQPVSGLTVFADGSGRTGKAAIVWQDKGKWESMVVLTEGSPQVVELQAIIEVFRKWDKEPVNIVSDSQYVVGVVCRLERAYLKHIDNELLFVKFRQLLQLLNFRKHTYYIRHIMSHTSLLGFLTQGNAIADQLAAPAWQTPVPDQFRQAQLSHEFFHQSAKVLAKQFNLPVTEAKLITSTCADCQQLAATPIPTVNPRGFEALQLWQTDITHIPEFGKLKYIHVSVDTWSHAVWASVHVGETSRHVQCHFREAFAVLGIPHKIKTDNGPAYISQSTRQFFSKWGISHVTGILHSPTGQAIIERTHLTLKNMLAKQKGGTQGETPANRIAKVLYVMNHLSLTGNYLWKYDRKNPIFGLTRESIFLNEKIVFYSDSIGKSVIGMMKSPQQPSV